LQTARGTSTSFQSQSSTGTGANGQAGASALQPTASRKGPELDAASQENRRKEIAARIEKAHADAGHLIVATTALDDGTIIDWVDAASVEGADAVPPPPLKLAPLPPGVVHQTLKLPEGPPGTISFIRPSFDAYVKGQTPARDLNDYISRIPAGHPYPDPAPASDSDRMYVADNVFINQVPGNSIFGGQAMFNTAWSTADVPSGQDFAIAELAVMGGGSFCGATNGSQVGAVVGRLPPVYSTSSAVFALEAFYEGTTGWVTAVDHRGYVPQPNSITPGTPLPAVSLPGLSGQTEYEMAVAHFHNDPGVTDGWWVNFDGVWIGHFPDSLFDAFIACDVSFYGEMLDVDGGSEKPNTLNAWMNADMGSGARPWSSSAGSNRGSIAYIRQPFIFTDEKGSSGVFSPAVSSSLAITDPYCYDGRWSVDGNSGWVPTLWLGGGGGNARGCNGDPGGHFGVRKGAYVCSPGCSQCTGTGCSNSGGKICCGGTIDAMGTDCMTSFAPCKIKTADPECVTGKLDSSGTACCNAGCSQCGGNGCSVGGGCCIGHITASCSSSMPPCLIDPPPKSP
jgi:hypothetical protein